MKKWKRRSNNNGNNNNVDYDDELDILVFGLVWFDLVWFGDICIPPTSIKVTMMMIIVMDLMITLCKRDKRYYSPQPTVFRGTKSRGPSLSFF